MSIAYHGNWCGPGWSDGKFQPSTRGFAPAIDEFDETCRQHDFALADNPRDSHADHVFIKANIGSGNPKRQAAATAVFFRNILEPAENKNTSKNQKMTKNKNLKNNSSKTSAPYKRVASLRPTKEVLAPVSLGSYTSMPSPKVSRNNDSARITGCDFIGTVECNGTATFGLGKSALMSPAFFQSTYLGNLCRSFERYKFNQLMVRYVPSVPTTVSGQVILCSQKSVSEPGLQPESGSFLSRALSQGNARMAAPWMDNFIKIDTDTEWRLVDPLTTIDADDCVLEELQVYTKCSVQGQVGYLIACYDIAFKEPIYQPHSTSLPIVTGPGLRAAMADTLAVNAAGDALRLQDAAGSLGLATVPNGTIYRMVFDIQGSLAPTGATFAGSFTTSTAWHNTTATLINTTTGLTIIGGLTVFGVVVGTSINVYTSMEYAAAGNGTGQIYYNAITSAKGTWNFDFQLLHVGVALQPTIQ
jgi:hypothetical protein